MERRSEATTSEPLSPEENELHRSDRINLYLSHSLSTWNARCYEFAATIFVVAAYPGTLLAASIRGLSTAMATIFLSSLMGRWVDRAPSRLRTLQSSIVVQRLCVLLSCLGWFTISSNQLGDAQERTPVDVHSPLITNPSVKTYIFTLLIILGIIEKLSASANILSMERDWVPTIAKQNKQLLTQLNASMRRIDLTCKLLGPVFVTLVVSLANVFGCIVVIAITNGLSILPEVISAYSLYRRIPRLREERVVDPLGEHQGNFVSSIKSLFSGAKVWSKSDCCIPSLCLSLLYFNVLSFSTGMIAYLLATNYSLAIITAARVASSVVELSATVVMPFMVRTLNTRNAYYASLPLDESTITPEGNNQDDGAGVERAGLWGIWWMLSNLVPSAILLSRASTGSSSPGMVDATLLFSFLALSRLGLWTYDLTAQTLSQTLVDSGMRGQFSGFEMSLISFFELCQFVATAIWNRPDDFKWLAWASTGAMFLAACGYSGWMKRRRGHLVHLEKLQSTTECLKKCRS